ncbi:MAG: tRNA (adenosine(37)-N6)-threonylcarbamoyltransferase complex dimerization subunit type 1 TsaB [Firmicutes bacterium]|nr:tRNA (adenosine(37)-N6)-threonylcarbamoyltransferase complex dimerization subunit type 1 TsaB [Bacillota bacterium]
MNILAIETTAAAASAAIIDGDECVHEVKSEANMTHLQNLMPLIEQVLEDCDLRLSDIGGIAVSRGPGSFTGIRIGMATAKGLAQVLKVPVAEVPTLKAMSMNGWNFGGIVCPVLDARRSQVYSAAYVFEEDDMKELLPEGAYDPQTVIDAVAGKGPVLFMGDGIGNPKIRTVLEEGVGREAFFASEERRFQTAEMVAVLGLEIFKEGKAVPYDRAQPEYLRKSEAERKREEKEKTK